MCKQFIKTKKRVQQKLQKEDAKGEKSNQSKKQLSLVHRVAGMTLEKVQTCRLENTGTKKHKLGSEGKKQQDNYKTHTHTVI